MFADEFERGLWTDAFYGIAVIATEEDTQVDELMLAKSGGGNQLVRRTCLVLPRLYRDSFR